MLEHVAVVDTYLAREIFLNNNRWLDNFLIISATEVYDQFVGLILEWPKPH